MALLVLGALAMALLAPAATAQVPNATADYSGYATGSVVHVDALQQASSRLVDVEEALSSAAVDNLHKGGQILNENLRVVRPSTLVNKVSYGLGSGLEAGLALSSPSAENTLLGPASRIDASAPVSTALQTKELVGPLKVSPLAYASVVRGQAIARSDETGGCILGGDISRGLGYAADAQLLDTGSANPDGTLGKPVLSVDAPSPDRAVAQSVSHETLVRQLSKTGAVVGPNFGLMSEVRETIAPITLLKGTPQQTTIEVLGEWVLQAVATGIPGQAYVWYGPGKVSPETPILRVLDATNKILGQLTFQQLTGQTGQVLDIPNVAHIVIGEDPRAIGGDETTKPTESTDGLNASAAVDVVRVKLLDHPGGQDLRAADIRVGHMEVKATVPAGGMTCSIPVTKTANPGTVTITSTNSQPAFTTSITVNNPFMCDLTSVKLTDVITTDKPTVQFKVNSTSPDVGGTADKQTSATLTWNDIGPIPAGGSKVVTVNQVAEGASGTINDKATATATLSNCTGEGSGSLLAGVASAVVGAGLSGTAALGEFVGADTHVLATKLARTGPSSADTVFAGLVVMVLAGLGYAVSRRRFNV